jgi:hypothetical protein
MDNASKIYQYIAVPPEVWEEMINKLNWLMEHVKGKATKLEDFYEEAELGEILGKKTTAMWELKKSGILPSYKIGNKTFYKKPDVMAFIEKSKQ